MTELAMLLWDVGGVLLSNAWDREARRKVVGDFKLDEEEFEGRHELVVAAFEKGQLRLDEYLDCTVFYQPRGFTRQAFKESMLVQSKPKPETLAVVSRLSRSRKYLLATLNNESLELNQFRIDRFELRNYFTAFFSSCFLGLRKPDEAIYRTVLQLTQRSPEQTAFIDDRALNLECAQRVGMHTIHFQSPPQVERDLRALGVVF